MKSIKIDITHFKTEINQVKGELNMAACHITQFK